MAIRAEIPIRSHKGGQGIAWWALTAVGTGLSLRLLFAWQAPFTNDEGAYLYDAATIQRGELPAGDALTKTPVVVTLFSLGVALTHASLWAARIISVVAAMLTALPLWYAARQLAGKEAARLVVIIWLCASGPIVLLSVGHTQAVANLLGAATVALWIGALRSSQDWRRWSLGAGAMFALAFAARKTSSALVLPLGLLTFLLLPPWWRSAVIRSLIAATACLVLWALVAGYLYGSVGVEQALGVGYASLALGTVQGVPEIKSWSEAWREVAHITARINAGLLISAAGGVALSLWYWYQKRLTHHIMLLVAVVWGMALTGLYATWPTFLTEYTADFLPPLVLLAGVLGWWLVRWPRVAILAVVSFSLINLHNLWSAYQEPWTGMFTAEAIQAAAAAVQEHVPADEPVLTAATIIPYASGHQVLFNIAHPQWYRYRFISSETRHTFLPTLDEVVVATELNQVHWILRDRLTDYAYLRADHRLRSAVQEWECIVEIQNRTGFQTNPLRLCRRP
jgi:4-amino-4-deoxy-L-arabinose transferase-like glycosyltransferase